MIVQQTLTQLRNLGLDGMAHAFEEQITLPSSNGLSFEDRFAMLVERPGGDPKSPTCGRVELLHLMAVNRRRSAPS